MTADKSRDDGFWTESFETVLRDEHQRINQWRRTGNRPPVQSRGTDPLVMHETTGVCLSGGGIRSAAFCLGALQALDITGKIPNIDYLSTVSGGGYIGASLIVGMDASGGRFPFTTGAGDKSDNHAIGQIRDYANYLMPHGLRDAIASVTVFLRGMAVNFAIVAGVILVAAAITRWFNPDQASLKRPDIFGFEHFPFHDQIAALGTFPLTRLLLLLTLAFMAIWGCVRPVQESWRIRRKIMPEVTPEFADSWFNTADFWHTAAVALLYLTALTAFLELQPYAIISIFEINYPLSTAPTATWNLNPASLASSVATWLAPFSALLAIFSKYFGDVIKLRAGEDLWSSRLKRAISRAMIWIVALALPLVIWVVYLHATIWADIGFVFRPGWLQAIVLHLCPTADIAVPLRVGDAPAVAQTCLTRYLVTEIYFVTGLAILIVAVICLRPNSNSLHRLYRDRLAKTFLFDPRTEATKSMRIRDPSVPPELGAKRLGELNAANAPVHLINTALNIQNSRVANKRGRQADFFTFSAKWSGSLATGYIHTDQLARREGSLDIATAMAISGAAISSNMGAQSVPGLAPTLALLNLRLGFWMPNPFAIGNPDQTGDLWQRAKYYLPAEMFSLLDEKSSHIYLTDGGHIENLGLYELLRRRCRTVLVVDGEADPNLDFRAFADAQRYARIDLGVQIDLPWDAIRRKARELEKSIAADDGECRKPRPDAAHVCVGTIDYGDGHLGHIIYVKACLTGDENDSILNYKLRHREFPHETTSDQFFTEEQFEVYRALGNHALRKALLGEAYVEGAQNLPGYSDGVMAHGGATMPVSDLAGLRRGAFDRLFA